MLDKLRAAPLKSDKLPCCSSAFEPHAVFLFICPSFLDHSSLSFSLSFISSLELIAKSPSNSPRPFRGCVLVQQQSQSRRACVVTPLPYRHNTACSIFPPKTVPKQAPPGWKRGRSPWKEKKYILTKTSWDNNHINNSPPGPPACQNQTEKAWKYKKKIQPCVPNLTAAQPNRHRKPILFYKLAFKFNPQVKSKSKIRRPWLGGVYRGLHGPEDGNKWK